MQGPRWVWLSLVVLSACAGRMDRTVRRQAQYDLSCPKESLAVEQVKERNFASSIYRADGCERREEYLVRCGVIGCVTEKTAEIAAREAARERANAGWPAGFGEPSPPPPPASASASRSPEPAPAGRAFVSMRMTNLCPQKVLLFHGRDPRSSGGRSDSIGANGSMNVSGSEGDTIWIVDESRTGLSSFTYSPSVREIFITQSCTGFSTRR